MTDLFACRVHAALNLCAPLATDVSLNINLIYVTLCLNVHITLCLNPEYLILKRCVPLCEIFAMRLLR